MHRDSKLHAESVMFYFTSRWRSNTVDPPALHTDELNDNKKYRVAFPDHDRQETALYLQTRGEK